MNITELQVKCDSKANIITLHRSDNIATVRIAYLMVNMSENAENESSFKS